MLPPVRPILNLAQVPGIIALPAEVDSLLSCSRVAAGEHHVPAAIFAIRKAGKLIATVAAQFRRVGFQRPGPQHSYCFNIYFALYAECYLFFWPKTIGERENRERTLVWYRELNL